MWAVRGSEQVRYLYTTGNTCISNIVPKLKKKNVLIKLTLVCYPSVVFPILSLSLDYKLGKFLRYRYFLIDTK